MRPHGYASSDRTPEHLPHVYRGPGPGARPDDEEKSVTALPLRSVEPILEAMASAWEVGRKAGEEYERSLWYWQAGPLSRVVNGLTERPERPKNPYEQERGS